jgi:C1A family cysteine protease
MNKKTMKKHSHDHSKIACEQDYEVLPEVNVNTVSPVLDAHAHTELLIKGLQVATKFGRVDVVGPRALQMPINGTYSLAQWQSGFKLQNDRGTCWAFAGAAALEAAYKRKYNMLIDVSEEYIFHMGKAFALNRDSTGAVITPIENNSSLTGFQGSGDVAKKISENAIPPEDAAPYLESQQKLLDILPVLGFAGLSSLATQEDYDALEFCEQHIPLLARVNARYRATGWGSLGNNPSITALENTILADREVICDVFHKTPNIGGHVLLLIGFDRNRQVFMAKNHWGEGNFIEIAYNNDPNWQIKSGWYITDVVDPTFVQNEACWLGNWWANAANGSFRISPAAIRRFCKPWLTD